MSGTAVRHGTTRDGKRPSPVGPKERRVPRGESFMSDIEAKSRTIRDPVAKLRYIRESLARYQEADRRVQAVPISPVRWLLYRITRLDRMRPLYSTNPNGAVPAPAAAAPVPARSGAGWAIALVGAAALGLSAYRLSRPADAAPPPAAVQSRLARCRDASLSCRRESRPRGSGSWRRARPGSSSATACASTRATRWPESPAAIGSSTGRRGLQPAVHTKPVGHPVPHVRERHLAARGVVQREACATAARASCATCSATSVYHYLIDRFGRVFRVVSEEAQGQPRGQLRVDAGGRRLHEPEQRLPRRLLRDAAGRAGRRCPSPRPSSRPGATSPTTCASSGTSRPRCAWPTASRA